MRKLNLLLTLCLSLPLYGILLLQSPFYNQFDIQLAVYFYVSMLLIFLAGAQWAMASEHNNKTLLLISFILILIPWVIFYQLLTKNLRPLDASLAFLALTIITFAVNFIFHRKLCNHLHKIYFWKAIVLFVAIVANLVHLIMAYD